MKSVMTGNNKKVSISLEANGVPCPSRTHNIVFLLVFYAMALERCSANAALKRRKSFCLFLGGSTEKKEGYPSITKHSAAERLFYNKKGFMPP